MLDKVKELLYNVVHTYKFAAAMGAVAYLVVSTVAPDLAGIISEEQLILLIATLLGITGLEKSVYDKLQAARD